MSDGNPWCDILGIAVPRLEDAARSRDANWYGLLLAALLERGAPLTLAEVAARFETAGIAPAAWALVSLKRCKPGRAPVYRDGDRYALDPYDDETDLWAFRLGLKPAHVPALRATRPDPGPLPAPGTPLTAAHLDEAWREGTPPNWSALRLAICVLDAHGRAMRPEEVVAFVDAKGRSHQLRADSATYWRRGAAVRVRPDGLWELDAGHSAVRSARSAVAERLAMVRKGAERWGDPAEIAAVQRRLDREREERAAELARLRRVLVHAFPADRPEAVVLVDVERRALTALQGAWLERVGERLAAYDLIGAVGVRGLLRALGCDPGSRRLAELGPPQQSLQVSRAGRTIRLALPMLVQGSCGIARPFGEEAALRRYLREGAETRLWRRLEADAMSLYALYQYGRLHGAVRVRRGFLDERIPAPWALADEPRLRELLQRAAAEGVQLEVVAGTAPGWEDPWSRARRVRVRPDATGWSYLLVDAMGYPVHEWDVQAARVAEPEPRPLRGGKDALGLSLEIWLEPPRRHRRSREPDADGEEPE